MLPQRRDPQSDAIQVAGFEFVLDRPRKIGLQRPRSRQKVVAGSAQASWICRACRAPHRQTCRCGKVAEIERRRGEQRRVFAENAPITQLVLGHLDRELQERIAQLRPVRGGDLRLVEVGEQLPDQGDVVVIKAMVDEPQLDRQLRELEITQVPRGIGVVDPPLQGRAHD